MTKHRNERNIVTSTLVIKKRTVNVWGTAFGLAVAVLSLRHDSTAAQAMIPLGSAAKFAVLAATTVTSTGATKVDGNLGVSPGTTVSGSPTVNGTLHLGDPTAAQAQADLGLAYTNAAGRPGGA